MCDCSVRICCTHVVGVCVSRLCKFSVCDFMFVHCIFVLLCICFTGEGVVRVWMYVSVFVFCVGMFVFVFVLC